MTPATDPFSFVLIGAGTVGTAVAMLLQDSGHRPVGVVSRMPASAERAASVLETTVVDQAPDADAYLIGAPLDAVPGIVDYVLNAVDVSGRYFVHFAGAAGIRPLQGAVNAGAHACALHPVQACPDLDSALRNLPGSVWGVTTSPDASVWSEAFVASVSGTALAVREDDRPLWHAAAVITSNGIAALLAGGEAILERLDVRQPEEVLGPLARGTLDNAVLGGGGGATLTGPVVRGELDSVREHFVRLKGADERLADFYALVSSLIVQAAARAERVPPDLPQRLDETLR